MKKWRCTICNEIRRQIRARNTHSFPVSLRKQKHELKLIGRGD